VCSHLPTLATIVERTLIGALVYISCLREEEGGEEHRLLLLILSHLSSSENPNSIRLKYGCLHVWSMYACTNTRLLFFVLLLSPMNISALPYLPAPGPRCLGSRPATATTERWMDGWMGDDSSAIYFLFGGED